jgi:hypothetical protein
MDRLTLNIPEKINHHFYESSFIEIKNYIFLKMDFVKSIIRYGNLKHPGISDLDLILVIKDGTKNKDYDFLMLNKYLKKNHSELIFHFPLLINQKLVSDINYLFPLFKYEIIDRKGRERKVELSSSDVQRNFHLLQIFLSKFPLCFQNYKEINNSNFRNFLLEINSLKHTFSIFKELHPDVLNSEISHFNYKIDKMRQDQIDGIISKKTELERFLEETRNLFFKMINILNCGKADGFFKNIYKSEHSSWVLNQLKLISSNDSILSRHVHKKFFGSKAQVLDINSYSKTLELLDTYITETSKFSIFFGSSTFITLGIETNRMKRLIKNVIQFF